MEKKMMDASLTNKNYTKDIIPEYNKLLAFKEDDLAVHFVKKNKIEREIMLIILIKKLMKKKLIKISLWLGQVGLFKT